MRYSDETDEQYIIRLERDLAYYRLLPDDYPNGDDVEDIAFRRARSWSSLWPYTHAGIDQQVRVCVDGVCDELEELRAEVIHLRWAIKSHRNATTSPGCGNHHRTRDETLWIPSD